MCKLDDIPINNILMDFISRRTFLF